MAGNSDNSDNLRAPHPAPGPDLARRGGGECEDCANYAATLHFRYFYRSVIADRWDSWNCCRAVLVQHCDSRSKSYDVYLGAIKMSVLGSSARLSQHKDRDQAKHQAVSTVPRLGGGQVDKYFLTATLASPRCCLSDCSGGESVEMLLAITKRTVSFKKKKYRQQHLSTAQAPCGIE